MSSLEKVTFKGSAIAEKKDPFEIDETICCIDSQNEKTNKMQGKQNIIIFFFLRERFITYKLSNLVQGHSLISS